MCYQKRCIAHPGTLAQMIWGQNKGHLNAIVIRDGFFQFQEVRVIVVVKNIVLCRGDYPFHVVLDRSHSADAWRRHQRGGNDVIIHHVAEPGRRSVEGVVQQTPFCIVGFGQGRERRRHVRVKDGGRGLALVVLLIRWLLSQHLPISVHGGGSRGRGVEIPHQNIECAGT